MLDSTPLGLVTNPKGGVLMRKTVRRGSMN